VPDLIRVHPDAAPGRGGDREGMARDKEYRFPVRVEWVSGRTVVAGVLGKPALVVSPPPEFNAEADPAVWSPEDLFCNAAATCLAVGIARLASAAEVPLLDLAVSAQGTVTRREDGRFGFTKLEQTVELEVEPGHEGAARELVERAESGCLVAASLDVAVETTVVVRTPAVAA
jgi:organic hydroperoxide reductase OsmC/OhrA